MSSYCHDQEGNVNMRNVEEFAGIEDKIWTKQRTAAMVQTNNFTI